MLEWVYGVVDKVEAEAKLDPDYRALVLRQAELAGPYEDLLARLSPEDRELILDYTLVREDMLYRMAQLAWQYGRKHR